MTNNTNLNVLGVNVNVFLDKAATGGQFSFYRCETPFQVGPPPHTHPEFDESFLVESGLVDLFFEGEWKTLHPGESVFIPRGAVHTFRGASETPARFIGIATPGGHEEFFFAMHALSEPTPEKIMAVLAEHRILPA